VGLGPIGVGRERERVEVRGHVARASRVRVEPPGPPHLVTALEHDEVLEALLLQLDRRPEPREAAADDHHVGLRRRRVASGLGGWYLHCCGHSALLVVPLSPGYVPVSYTCVTYVVLRWPHKPPAQPACPPRSGASSCSTPPSGSSPSAASTPCRSRPWRGRPASR